MARSEAEEKAQEARERIAQRRRIEGETGRKANGRDPVIPAPDKAVPDPKAQRNFTDPDSRIMKDGATKGFEQCYNTQNVVDEAFQIIVVAEVTQDPNDNRQLIPMLGAVKTQTGQLPDKASADAGYCSEANLNDERAASVDLFVATGRERKLNTDAPTTTGKQGKKKSPRVRSVAFMALATTVTATLCLAGALVPPPNTATQLELLTAVERMRRKLQTAAGKAEYAKRKAIVEPVHGQIKEQQGVRRFLFRGLSNARNEWRFVSACHNIRKMFRYATQTVADLLSFRCLPMVELYPTGS